MSDEEWRSEFIAETRAALQEAERRLAAAKLESTINATAVGQLKKTMHHNLLAQTGLGGHVVRVKGSTDRFVVEEAFDGDTAQTLLLHGPYINKKGKASPILTMDAPLAAVEDLGEWLGVRDARHS